jgi:D-apiose dehydrogenase
MNDLRFAIFGTGFWSRFQLAAWHELQGAQCVALYDRTRSKAEALAEEFGVSAVYDDPEALLASEDLDFIDIITDVDTHSRFVHMAAAHGLDVICQKPMAPDLATAQAMQAACEAAGVQLLIHENFRWQTPLRSLKGVLAEGRIGTVFRARLSFNSSFPVFDNQPFLKEIEQFMLADVGSHILDTARFLFGEAESLSCQTIRVNPEIVGEDVATVMLKMVGGSTVVCEMSYATRSEFERFPETFAFVEGDGGSVALTQDHWIRVTTEEGTFAKRYPPPRYAWADPAYDVVQASIVPCNADLLQALQGKGAAETTGSDNVKTMELVYGSYESAARGERYAVGGSGDGGSRVGGGSGGSGEARRSP